MDVDLSTIDHALHIELERLVRERGPCEVAMLVRLARKARRDARIDEEAVASSVDSSTLLVWRPEGTVDHLLRVLDGMVLTQRVRAPLAGRADLWATVSLQPLLNIAAYTAVPLADGRGEVTRASSGHEVLLGPTGWLPDIPRYGVVGLRLVNGTVEVEPVDESAYPELAQQQRVRELLVQHYRLERWYTGTDDLASRPGEMVRALGHAKLEDPDLLCTPHPPLEELLSLALEKDRDVHYWREFAAQQEFTCAFYVNGMPDALRIELDARATRYGMSFDQYVIAVLGHLAWRTPFAEDMEPWQDWEPQGRASASVTALVDGVGDSGGTALA